MEKRRDDYKIMTKRNILSFLPIFITFLGCASNQLYHADFSRGEKMFSSGNYEEAIKSYTKFLKSDPKDERRIYAENKLSEAYYKLGKKYYDKEDYKNALILFYHANLEEADEEMAKCHYAIASKLVKEKKYEDALSHIDSVMEDFKKSSIHKNCLYLKLYIEFEVYKEEECIKTYKQLIESYPRSKLIEEAKSIINKISRNSIAEADNLYTKGEYVSALDRYREILTWGSDYEEELDTKINKALIYLRMNEGNKALQEQDLEKAEAFFKNVLELDSSNTEARARLSEIASLREKMEKEERYKIFADSHPDWSERIINLIMQRKIVEGMTTEMVKVSWGNPDIIEHSSAYGTIYTYKHAPGYGKEVMIYFKNGKCYRILK